MSLNISSKILSLPGQRVKQVQHDLALQRLTIHCKRDRRYRAIDPSSNEAANINRYLRRTIRDVPLCGFECYLEVELAQVVTTCGRRLMEACEFVDTGNRYTQRAAPSFVECREL
ncbi:hypothetical protein [Marinagarivorans cellulosilyticus]|uniref:hypothetical protein n=1 Tax=Marinagarivorans cellulosilyticus TaxID=2721545 RepID=UPI001F2877B3|nr:hypothetical protein [Marinagarivorans cellulosilyticus]